MTIVETAIEMKEDSWILLLTASNQHRFGLPIDTGYGRPIVSKFNSYYSMYKSMKIIQISFND